MILAVVVYLSGGSFQGYPDAVGKDVFGRTAANAFIEFLDVNGIVFLYPVIIAVINKICQVDADGHVFMVIG